MSRKAIVSGVDVAFREAAKISATKTINLSRRSSTGLDANTLQPVAATVVATGTAILYSYSARQIDGVGIKVGDQGAILRFSEFPTVTVDDSITVDSEDWQIVTVNPDPTSVVWEVQLRK